MITDHMLHALSVDLSFFSRKIGPNLTKLGR